MQLAVAWGQGVLLLALAGTLTFLPGQEPTVLRGRVLSDVEGRPVPGVELRFEAGPRVLTDAGGRFEVRGLAPGEHEVVLVTGRCAYSRGRVRVVPGTTWETHLTLPEELARAPAPPEPPGGEGTFLTAADLQDMRASDMADVVRRVAPEMVGGPRGQPGQVSRLRGRNRATVTGRTEPVIVVDGQLQGASPRLLSELRPADVAAVHIAPGAGGAWKYGSSGGLVEIWTRRGPGGAGVGRPEACPDPPPPGQEDGSEIRPADGAAGARPAPLGASGAPGRLP